MNIFYKENSNVEISIKEIACVCVCAFVWWMDNECCICMPCYNMLVFMCHTGNYFNNIKILCFKLKYRNIL